VVLLPRPRETSLTIASHLSTEELEAAIGDPYGRSGLRDRARDVDERWEDKRGELNEGLG